MHSSRMRTARLLAVSRSIRWGGLPNLLDADHPGMQTPRCRPPSMQTPRMQTPLNADHPSMQTPPPTVNRMTDREL